MTDVSRINHVESTKVVRIYVKAKYGSKSFEIPTDETRLLCIVAVPSNHIFSRTNGPTSTKLGTNHNSWVRGSLFVQMPDKTLCYGEIIAKSQTTLTTWKMFTLELRGQFQPCLAQSILWWRDLILSKWRA